jgi:hypothetical protein
VALTDLLQESPGGLAQVDHERVILADFEDFFEGKFLIFQNR